MFRDMWGMKMDETTEYVANCPCCGALIEQKDMDRFLFWYGWCGNCRKWVDITKNAYAQAQPTLWEAAK
jgi:hypothetical protein